MGIFTLITLSVMPVSVDAISTLELCLTTANSDKNPLGKTVESCNAEEAERIKNGTINPQANQKTKSLIPLLFDFAGGIVSTVLMPIFLLIMSVSAVFLAFSGLILNYIIDISVVNLAKNLEGIVAINNTWKVIRDLGNMSFIFILLYEGIRMVLGLGGTGVKKVVSGIIIAAILVNFSLFFTKAIIDASNIVTLGFYKSIVSSGTTQIAGYDVNVGLAGAFMKAVRLSSLYTANIGTIALSGPQGATIFLGNTLFMLVATFVFLAVGVMFLIRYLSFIILLIMSPIYFISMAVPGLDDLKKKYSQTLMSQALFAPVYMLLTWVTLTLAEDSSFLKSTVTESLGDAIARPDGSSISLIVDYILIIGLLIYSLILSKNVGTKAGMVTSKIIDKGQAYLGGTVFGGASWAGRSTLGRYGQKVANDSDLQARAARGDIGARLKLSVGNRLATSSFDARNTDTVGAITKQTGSFGKGINTKGYRGYLDEKLEEQEKKDKARSDQFKMSDEEKKKHEDSLKEYEKTDEEKNLKKDHLEADTKKIKSEKVAIGVSALEKTISDLESVRKENEKKEKETAEQIANLDKKLARTTITEERQRIIDNIDSKEKTLELIQTTLNNTKGDLEKQNKLFDGIKKTDAYKEIVDKEEKFKADEKEWISPKYEGLISMAGGKKDTQNKRIKAIQTENNNRIEAYANRLEEKRGLLNGYPNIRISSDYSKRRAAAIRKLIKAETKEAKALKVLKESLAEEDKEEAPKKEEPKDTTPPATPTP